MGKRSTSRTIGTMAVAATAAAGMLAATAPSSVAAPSAQKVGEVSLIQAVPDMTMTATVDGKAVPDDAPGDAVLGTVGLAPGQHEVVFADASGATTAATTVQVDSGASSDVVIHRPAEVGGAPVVNVYTTPTDPIGPGKARVLLAHTATTAPADVEVDGTTVFTNIANGEYAEADVAAGSHQVALLPSGVMGNPILGPLDVKLAAGTVTTVYAVGNPRNGSMNVIVRESDLRGDGAKAPVKIETGSAGLVADFDLFAFTGSH